MINKYLAVALLIGAGLIIGGCFHRPISDVLPSFDQVAITTPAVDVPGDVATQTSKFYPKPTASTQDQVVQPVDDSVDRDSFAITPELKARLYLVDIYNPGICYGLPGPVPDISIATILANNQGLSQFLRSSYKLSSDLDVYTKIKQINSVMLNSNRNGYQFNFTDAQCCTLKAYQGEINTLGPELKHTIDREETKQNPC